MTVEEIWREVGSALDVRAGLDRLGARVSHHVQKRRDLWSMSIDEMLAPPGMRAIYEALDWSFDDTSP